MAKRLEREAKRLDKKIALTPGPPGENAAENVVVRESVLSSGKRTVTCMDGERVIGGGAATAPPDALSYLIVGRSLLAGEGYTVHFVDLHLGTFDPIRHVPEMHGLLQPLPFAALQWGGSGHVSLIRIPGFFYIAGASLARSDGGDRDV